MWFQKNSPESIGGDCAIVSEFREQNLYSQYANSRSSGGKSGSALRLSAPNQLSSEGTTKPTQMTQTEQPLFTQTFQYVLTSTVGCRNIASIHWFLKEKNELNRANKAEAKLLCISDCLVFGMWTKCFRL